MNDQIYVIEVIVAMPGQAEKLQNELLALVAPSRQETGCQLYDLYRDHNNSDRFAIHICFQNQEAYERHINASHIQEFCKRFENILYGNENIIEDFYKKLS